MAAQLLHTHRVTKPWGRHDLAPLFADQPADQDAIGEIWFEDDSGPDRELLIKYLFTSQKLSVQVHPDDAAAQARGYKRGKDEAWVVLAADPHATIGLGLTRTVDADAFRQAALDGSIEQLVDWRPVKAGDVIYSPAGTVHAIGAGLIVMEIQQNLDLTYRLYDYGSDRELHLEEGLAVSLREPYVGIAPPRPIGAHRLILSENVAFVLERWSMAGSFTIAPGNATIWLLPVEGRATVDGQAVAFGEAMVVEGAAAIEIESGSKIFAAYPGGEVIEALLEPVSETAAT
ncbi:MAG: phosphoheptose isomerase [Rhizorhabdus sp.]|nr:phosphoheptose isomerase [Rhizorhabdus sp.]